MVQSNGLLAFSSGEGGPPKVVDEEIIFLQIKCRKIALYKLSLFTDITFVK